MPRQKRVAAIHDISGFGRCSLTVALPIISATGVECTCMPTAVLSTHTGGFDGFTYRDLTEDLMPIAEHWKSLNIEFDALYSGYLGSFEQLDIVSRIFDMHRGEGIVLVDPVMADHGELYASFSPDFPAGMAKLCGKADIVVPNITEACLMTGTEFKSTGYDKDYIETLLKKLGELGAKQVVLTGVSFDDMLLGAATFNAATGHIDYVYATKINAFYHGTGDVFGSALLAALMNDKDLKASTQIACDYTAASIKRTFEAGTDDRYGVEFERELPALIKMLGLE